MERLNFAQVEQPFPIQRHFLRRILPLLLFFLAVLLGATTVTTLNVVEKIYLQLALGRSEGIAKGVERQHPELWWHFIHGHTLGPRDFSTLAGAIGAESREFGVKQLKVYDADRRILFSNERARIGEIYDGAILSRVLATGKSTISKKKEKDEELSYEMYVPLHRDGKLGVIFELYEPVAYLDGILLRAVGPLVGVSGLIFLFLVVALALLVKRAQGDIDLRTQTINILRERLESLVSRGAVAAVRRSADTHGGFVPEILDCALFYSDIRGFTAFSEQHTPKAVIDFLNMLMSIQVEVIHGFHGDVDKMIGDAVLARFLGSNKAAQALGAAQEIQRRFSLENFPRGIGIGVHCGQVIVGGIGPVDRVDYTMIGDAVNVSARLCSLAQRGEVVCDVDTLMGLPDQGFGEEQMVRVKGREGALRVRHWSL